MDEFILVVEFLLLDEVFMDFVGIEKLYGVLFVVMFVCFVKCMKDELGIIGFIGFSYNKFFVKVVFDFDKF